MTEREYKSKLESIRRKNIEYDRKRNLRNAKKYGIRFKLPSTSKIVLFAVLALCIQIVIFSERMMEQTGDISALYTLIGIPVALVPIMLGYFNKSAKENTVGGIVYETAMIKDKASG